MEIAHEGLQLGFTKHASRRAAGRAIDAETIAAVLEHGRLFWAGRGCVAYFLGRRTVAWARRRYRLCLERFRDIAVILSPEGKLITVEHCHRPPRHWKRA